MRTTTIFLTTFLLLTAVMLAWGAPPTRYRIVELPDTHLDDDGHAALDPEQNVVIGVHGDGTGLAIYRGYPDAQRLTPVALVTASIAIVRIRGGRIVSEMPWPGPSAQQAFVWEHGQVTVLPKLDERDVETWPVDVNAESIIGMTYPWFNPPHYILWTKTPSGYVAQAAPIQAFYLNSRSDMVGRTLQAPYTCAVWLQPGTLLSCEPAGVTGVSVVGINQARQVVGTYTLDGHRRGFVWTPLSGALPLAPLHGYDNSTVSGINDDGDIVGSSFDQGTFPGVPTLWDNGRPRDLSRDVEDLHGRVLRSVEAINNLGAILVTVSDPNGNRSTTALLLPITPKHLARR